ncbi:MAG: AraC family transcriptional regulator [Gammaproteobacteria bacterium]
MLISGAQQLDSATMDGSLFSTSVYCDLSNSRHPEAWSRFLEKAGRENLLVHARTRFRHCEQEPNCMTLRAVWGGAESLHFSDGRHLRLDDDCFIILNDDSSYTTQIAADQPVNLFTAYFCTGMVQEVYAAFTRPLEELLENTNFINDGQLRFNEHVREHGGEITNLLKVLVADAELGKSDGNELHERVIELLFAMIRSENRMWAAADKLGLARHNTRHELFRRLHRARDFIHGHYEQDIDIKEMAAHASISTCHFVRFFKKCFDITPHQYLCKKRSIAAERLIKSQPDMLLAEIAQNVGFENRQTLFRNLKKFTGQAPSSLRNSQVSSVRQIQTAAE